MQGFKAVTSGYRCEEPHALMAIADIEPLLRTAPLATAVPTATMDWLFLWIV
jgi:hypothetical protein